MKSFIDGGAGFETTLGSWQIAARPVVASQEKCVACHNSAAFGMGENVAFHHALGGVVYAFQREVKQHSVSR